MARPQKKGIDYFPFDVDIDYSDDIVMLEAKYGNDGFTTIVKLFCKIYQDDGYFIKWNEKSSLLLSKRVNVDIKRVNDIINDLIGWEVFDSKLFKKYNILTSNRIQNTYLEATKKRKSIDLEESYILVENINDNINLINSVINPQSKVKNSKVNKSKEKNYRKFAHLKLTQKEFDKLIEDGFTKSQIDNTLDSIENYRKNTSYKSLNLTLRKWLKKDTKNDLSNAPDYSEYEIKHDVDNTEEAEDIFEGGL